MSSVAQTTSAIPQQNESIASVPSAKDPGKLLPWLPCTVSLVVPVVRFTIGDLLKLDRGSIVETACHHTSDIPLRANGQLIGWTEFEVIGNRLAVRVTELA